MTRTDVTDYKVEEISYVNKLKENESIEIITESRSDVSFEDGAKNGICRLHVESYNKASKESFCVSITVVSGYIFEGELDRGNIFETVSNDTFRIATSLMHSFMGSIGVPPVPLQPATFSKINMTNSDEVKFVSND